MILHDVSFVIHGRTHRERRVCASAEQLTRQLQALACPEWPITDIKVELPPK